MASRRYPFQGQFGVHETSLTTVIGYGEFKAAEQIIENTTDPSYLNDGRYENIPLHMVLSNNHYSERCRNLKLARLLVQKGANPNLRIPYGDMDEASPSAFEELVVYYELLKAYVAGDFDALCEELEIYFETDHAKLVFLTNTVDLDNEKCLPVLKDIHKLVKQTNELIDVFLYYGSDPSVRTNFCHKSLFHWVVEHEDVDLAKRFLDTCRVNLEIKDVHGSSTLMDAILRNKPQDALLLYETMCETNEDLDLNCHDCCGETALFRAMFVGATELTIRLCQDGASISTTVCLAQVPIMTCKDPELKEVMLFPIHHKVNDLATPLLAPLLADSIVQMHYTQISPHDCITKVFLPHKHLADKIISAAISPLIDVGCFSNEIVAKEILSLLECTNFRSIKKEDINPVDLLTLMFGKVSAGLRQLCVRTIFDHCIMSSKAANQTWLDAVPVAEVNDPWASEKEMIPEKTKALVEMLGLPPPLQIFFDIDAAKYQISGLIMSHGTMECDQDCSASDDDSIYDDDDDDDDGESCCSDVSSMYADSDSLLFFSSDISEESSEEIDDLSEEDSSAHEEKEEEDSEKGIKKGEAAGKGKHELKKIKYEPESSTSESENVRVVVETFCEDLAEDVAQDCPAVCCDKYQRLTDESTTTTTESPENLTASDSVSDSLC